MITILGGSLAGCAAAIAARSEGAEVTVIEKSVFPRHKVCGEFLTGEAIPALERLGMTIPEAAAIRRVELQFARRRKTFVLPEPACGVSRYLLDHRLQQTAASAGARFVHSGNAPLIVATGRTASAPRGRRLFGFKAHYRGLSNDAIELYFFKGGYTGVSAIEDGLTNVCGVLPEDELRRWGFDPAAAIQAFTPLRDRLAGSTPTMDWLITGPLVYGSRIAETNRFLCGDALLFTDPFTGSGMYSAIATGAQAGKICAQSGSMESYRAACDKILARAFRASGFIRGFLRTQVAESLVSLIPGSWLYRLTRPAQL